MGPLGQPIRYVADDNQGNVGLVEFQADGAVAAVSARAADRRFNRFRAIEMAPSELRAALAHLCDLPLLRDGPGVSIVFWTVGEFMQSPDSWQDTLHSGAELFQRELLADPLWEPEGIAYYGLPANVAQLAMTVARRATVRSPLVRLSEHEFRQLVPKDSEHETEALDLLMSDGLFEIAGEEPNQVP